MISALKDPAQIEQMKLLFLGAGFAAVWLGIAGYLMSIARRQANLEKQIDEIRVLNDKSPRL